MVRAVIDGVTINVAGVGRVRLLGIDVMKTSRRFDLETPLGRQARERLRSLVLNHWVRLEYDAPVRGTVRPRAAHVVREDGLFINAVLVREGLARISLRPPVERLDELQDAEREARRFGRGVWDRTGQRPSGPERTRRSRLGEDDATKSGRYT
jgi:micrococcal nuclease